MNLGPTDANVRFLRDSAHPAESPHTDTVAAALASGLPLAPHNLAYHRVQNADGTGHIVVWGLNGSAQAHFKPDFAEERLTFDELRRRFDSVEWCEAHPFHPVSYMRAVLLQKKALLTRLRELPLEIRTRRGHRTLILPENASPEVRAKWEAEFRK